MSESISSPCVCVCVRVCVTSYLCIRLGGKERVVLQGHELLMLLLDGLPCALFLVVVGNFGDSVVFVEAVCVCVCVCVCMYAFECKKRRRGWVWVCFTYASMTLSRSGHSSWGVIPVMIASFRVSLICVCVCVCVSGWVKENRNIKICTQGKRKRRG